MCCPWGHHTSLRVPRTVLCPCPHPLDVYFKPSILIKDTELSKGHSFVAGSEESAHLCTNFYIRVISSMVTLDRIWQYEVSFVGSWTLSWSEVQFGTYGKTWSLKIWLLLRRSWTFEWIRSTWLGRNASY